MVLVHTISNLIPLTRRHRHGHHGHDQQQRQPPQLPRRPLFENHLERVTQMLKTEEFRDSKRFFPLFLCSGVPDPGCDEDDVGQVADADQDEHGQVGEVGGLETVYDLIL